MTSKFEAGDTIYYCPHCQVFWLLFSEYDTHMESHHGELPDPTGATITKIDRKAKVITLRTQPK